MAENNIGTCYDKNYTDDEDYSSLLLENQLCFPLYVCAKEIINSYTPFLSKIDLTYTQYITMMVMWEEKKVSSGRLKERLFLDSGTLTPVLKKLEEKGFITKERSKNDARDLILTLTESGEKLKKECLNVPSQMRVCLGDIDYAQDIKELLEEMMSVFRKRRMNFTKCQK